MKLLAFDTSGKACSVALCYGKKVKALHKIAPMQQSSLILPMIQDLLTSFSLRANQLDAIAYGCGPGSFTGIRIASGVAQALSFARQLPIIRISSLAAMAHTAFLESGWDKSLIAVDAKCGQVYWAIYEYNQEARTTLLFDQEILCTPQTITKPIGFDWYGIGDGWGQYLSPFTMRLGFEPKKMNVAALPKARALLKIAKIKYDEGEFVSVAEALPQYLHSAYHPD